MINVERSQLLVPRKMRDALLQKIHVNVAGHLSVSKTQQHVQKRAYWYGWRRDVGLFCRACVPCNQYFRGMTPRQGRLQDMRTGAPMERLHVGLAGPFPRPEPAGMTYICSCICAFTKYAVAVPIPDKSAIALFLRMSFYVLDAQIPCFQIMVKSGKMLCSGNYAKG